MTDEKVWTQDRCTCGCPVSKHHNGDGRCKGCDEDRAWARDMAAGMTRICLRFQWNGEERRRVW